MAAQRAPQDVECEMRFGESWDAATPAEYHSLQYKFKPQSAGRHGHGALKIDQNSVGPYIKLSY